MIVASRRRRRLLCVYHFASRKIPCWTRALDDPAWGLRIEDSNLSRTGQKEPRSISVEVRILIRDTHNPQQPQFPISTKVGEKVGSYQRDNEGTRSFSVVGNRIWFVRTRNSLLLYIEKERDYSFFSLFIQTLFNFTRFLVVHSNK